MDKKGMIERRQLIGSQILHRKSIAIWSCKSDQVDLGLIWLVFRSFQKDKGLFDDSKSLDNIRNKSIKNSEMAFGFFCNYWIVKQIRSADLNERDSCHFLRKDDPQHLQKKL